MNLDSKPPEVRNRIVLLIVGIIGILLIALWGLSLRHTTEITDEDREMALKPFQDLGAQVQAGFTNTLPE